MKASMLVVFQKVIGTFINILEDGTISYQGVRLLIVELLSQELDDSHELVGCCDLEDILLQNWCVPNCPEAYNN